MIIQEITAELLVYDKRRKSEFCPIWNVIDDYLKSFVCLNHGSEQTLES